MKKTLSTLVLCLSLFGCDDLSGTIQTQSPLTLKVKKGKLITLDVGSHAAKFDYDESDRELEIKIKDASGKEQKAELKIPSNVAIPERNGSFSLSAAQSGQAFDLSGNVQTQVDTNHFDGTESCTYTERHERCREVEYIDERGRRR